MKRGLSFPGKSPVLSHSPLDERWTAQTAAGRAVQFGGQSDERGRGKMGLHRQTLGLAGTLGRSPAPAACSPALARLASGQSAGRGPGYTRPSQPRSTLRWASGTRHVQPSSHAAPCARAGHACAGSSPTSRTIPACCLCPQCLPASWKEKWDRLPQERPGAAPALELGGGSAQSPISSSILQTSGSPPFWTHGMLASTRGAPPKVPAHRSHVWPIAFARLTTETDRSNAPAAKCSERPRQVQKFLTLWAPI